jgi:two-component system OmpR family response regulator
MSDNGHILVVDDQKEICDVVQEYLTGEGYRVPTANDGNGMRRALGQSHVDLAILDLMLPGEDWLPWRAGCATVGIGIILTAAETVDRSSASNGRRRLSPKTVPPPRALAR